MKKDEMEKELDRGAPEQETEETRAEESEEQENGGEAEAPKDPGETLREICRGTLKMIQPFRAHGEDVLAVPFDFCGLTGSEMMDALDSVPGNGVLALSNKQALALFAATAEKCAPMVADGNRMTRMYDAKDIVARISAADSVIAVQLARLFFGASSRAGGSNISKG